MKVPLQFLFLSLLFAQELHAQSENIILGKKAFANRNYNEAIKYFKKEIQSSPQNCEGYYYLGLTYERMNNKDTATSYFLQATKVHCPPQIKEQAFWKAFNYYRYLEDWDKIYNVGKAFLQFKYSKEVDRWVTIASERRNDTENSGSTTRLEKLRTAKRLEERNEFQNAAMIYEELYEQDPKLEYLIKAGNLYREAKNSQKAFQVFRKVLDVDPDNWYGNYQAGLYYFNQGFLDKSLDHLKTSLRNIKKTNDKNYYNLLLLQGFVYFAKGDIENARKNLILLEKTGIKKDENYTILKNFIYKNYMINAMQGNASIDDDRIFLYQLLYHYYREDYRKLYDDFTSRLDSYSNILRWSNYVYPLYLILIFEMRHDREALTNLSSLYQNPLIHTMEERTKNYSLVDAHFAGKQDLNGIDKEFLSLDEKRKGTIINIMKDYYLGNYSKVYEELVSRYPGSDLLSYIQALVLLQQNSIDEGFSVLYNLVTANPRYKAIIREETFIQTYLTQHTQNSKKLMDVLESQN